MGYSREEFLQRTMADIDDSVDANRYAQLLADLQSKGGAMVHRHQRRRDGSAFPSEVSVNLVHLDRDYIVAAIRDISKREAAKEALRQSEERFRLVSENIADLLAIIDPSGVCEYASPSHLQDGLPPHTVEGQDYLSLIHPGDVSRVRDAIARVVEGHGHQSIEFRLRTGEGFWRFKDASMTLIVDDAGARLLVLVRDMTERKLQDEQRQELEHQLSERNAVLEKTIAEVRQMQEGLIQSEKMASIGQLTAGIAHEINNPLAFVSSNLNRFGEYFSDVLSVLKAWDGVKAQLQQDPQFQPLLMLIAKTEEQADVEFAATNFPVLMTHTSEGTERIRSIVDRLRGFSHMATESYAEADMNAALDDTINLTWNELKYKATIVKEYGEVPRISCNIGEIKQVLVNLLVNAAQALKDKGTITLRTKEDAGNLVVQVADTGSGIPEEHLKRIFDPFFTTKPVGKGTGLGLWISATIIQKHGGNLTVDSVVGSGTTMTIALPLVRDAGTGEAA
ncbi:MAG: PAS domain S-box protein [Ignavibacteriae bacterium]|nr:PAS domain S-box protein [Ignavibacteriota bacterium]